MEEKSSPIPLIQWRSGRREVKQIGNASSQAWISVIPLDKYSQLHSSPLHRLLWKYFADTVKFISYCNEDSVKFLTVYRNWSSLQPGEWSLFVPYSLRERSLVMQAQQLTLTNGGTHFNVDWRKGDAGLLGNSKDTTWSSSLQLIPNQCDCIRSLLSLGTQSSRCWSGSMTYLTLWRIVRTVKIWVSYEVLKGQTHDSYQIALSTRCPFLGNLKRKPFTFLMEL